MDVMRMKSLVIIPAFNEEKNLPRVLDEIQEHLPGFDIVVVNDGSYDATAQTAQSKGAGVISHAVNVGYGAAVQTGFAYARENGYATVLLMDGDGQHDARDGATLVRALVEHSADMVIGSRFQGRSPYKTTFARVVGKNIFSLVTYLVTHKSFVDITSGFRALNRRAVEFLSRNYPVDFPDAEVIIMLLLCGFKVAEAPATFRKRTCGRSMFCLSKKIYYPFKGMLAIFIVIARVMFKKEGSYV